MSKYVLLSFDLSGADSANFAEVYDQMKAKQWTKRGPSTNMIALFKDETSNSACVETSKSDLQKSCRESGVTLKSYVIAVCAQEPTFG